MNASQAVEAGSPTSRTLEPYRHGDGWRVETTCRHCGVTVYLDSPDELPAEELWGDQVEPEERGTMVKLGKPNEDALKIAAFAIGCEDCVSKQQASEESSKRRRGLSYRVEQAGLPRDLHGLAWSDMDRSGHRRDAIAACRSWSERGGRVLLTGPVGTGKTRLAATAMWDLLERGVATWISVPLLFVHAFMPATSPERRRAVEVMGGTGPLILDDLGKEKPGEWARQILFGAIDSRLQAGSPILITSNFDPDEIADRLGEAVGSRLQEFSQFELAGRDRREPEALPI